MSKIALYSFWRSSAAWRVRSALILKGIKYEYIAINLFDDVHKKPAYTKINPMNEVPTLEIDGRILGQSVAILEYLEETR